MTFPENLRTVRTAENLTQAQAADRLGIGKRTLELWESGERSPAPAPGSGQTAEQLQQEILSRLAAEESTVLRLQLSPKVMASLQKKADEWGLSLTSYAELSLISNSMPSPAAFKCSSNTSP